jgi:hypothetical protein
MKAEVAGIGNWLAQLDQISLIPFWLEEGQLVFFQFPAGDVSDDGGPIFATRGSRSS